jgi:hypothetical protein
MKDIENRDINWTITINLKLYQTWHRNDIIRMFKKILDEDSEVYDYTASVKKTKRPPEPDIEDYYFKKRG